MNLSGEQTGARIIESSNSVSSIFLTALMTHTGNDGKGAGRQMGPDC